MNLKNIFFLFTFSFSTVLLAQDNTSQRLKKANKAIEIKDYIQAIKIYKKLVDKNKYNVNFQLNLAELYFLTNDINKGCECAYFATIVTNDRAENLFNINCNDYKGKIKFLKDVDTPPLFLYEGEYQKLIENNVVNPNYLRLIERGLRLHKYVYLYDFSRVKINPKIGDNGQFIGKIEGLEDNKNNKEMGEIRSFLESIIFFKIKYKPAIYKNEPVEIFEDFYLNM